ncbi:MAG: hypothetical protein ACREP7_18320, partial [Lysobacter sp.]
MKVARLEDIGRFMADVEIRCAQCGAQFQFLGLRPGLNLSGATCNLEATEARLAIAPPGMVPTPFQQMQHGLKRLD